MISNIGSSSSSKVYIHSILLLDVLLMSSLHDWQVSLLKKKLGAKIGSWIIAAVLVVASKRKTTHQIWRQYLWIFLQIHKNEFCISKMCILCLGHFCQTIFQLCRYRKNKYLLIIFIAYKMVMIPRNYLDNRELGACKQTIKW